ncbi:MAG: ASKHA domain-containing protein [Firmicutes bacterium]|nr:ASKHA domain-containing protein [Bacillota bacterium]
MPEITFLPDNITVSLAEGAPLLEGARLAGVFAETPCGGKGTCGKCAARVLSGSVDFRDDRGAAAGGNASAGFFNETGNKAGENSAGRTVLICRTNVKNEPVVVELPKASGEAGKFDAGADVSRCLPESRESFLKSVRLTVAPPAFLDGLSDADRFARAFRETVNLADEKYTDATRMPTERAEVRLPVGVLAELPEKLRAKNGEVTAYYYLDGGLARVVDIDGGTDADGGVAAKNLGVAVDIGTTTVALWVADMDSGAVLASETAYNAQIECGLDVISRINYAGKYRRELKDRVLGTINGLIGKALTSAAHGSGADAALLHSQKDGENPQVKAERFLKRGAIRCASLAGNTTMIHLLLGLVPEYIRLAPYTPAVFELPLCSAGEIGLNINENAPVYIAPAVGSYVGGDITSGALCTGLAGGGETVLFIDIGTNGEILLGNDEFIFGCACSAGPAFEGGGIKCGMRASAGAIERVVIDPMTGAPEIFVIGGSGNGAKPAGICGSGIISIAAELFRTGLIDSAGKFTDRDCAYIVRSGKTAEYRLCEGISVGEPDLDNFIRAKGAVFSACRTIMDSVGMSFADIDRVVIAGGFGRFLNLEDARTVGLLPRLPDGKYEFLGNTSLAGAYLALVSEERRAKENEIARRITYVDLSGEAGYMDNYTAALFLPHTDIELFQ